MVGMSIKDYGEVKGEKHVFNNSNIKILFLVQFNIIRDMIC